ncbi:MAG: class I SAM-dependent methyltransferase [Thermoplasmata archaeon]|nr:class I SAM-dependent methyltransferase [Thermoplasmata archaeon]
MAPGIARDRWKAVVTALGDRRAAPNLRWVAQLTGRSEPEVTRAFDGILRHRAAIAEIRRSHVEGGRDFYAQIRAPLDLYALVRLIRPDAVVETGVSSGVSSSHFLFGLQDNRHGRLYSVDLPTPQQGDELQANESPVSLPPGRKTGWAVPDGLRERWDLSLGPSQELLPAVADRAGKIGLFLHDSLHTPRHLTFELETVRPHLLPGAVVLADNTEWTGQAFDRFARSLGVPLVRRGRSGLVGVRIPTEAMRASAPRRTSRSRSKR